MTKNKEHKSAIGVVIFIILLVAAAIVFSVYTTVNTVYSVVDLPQIKISIPSKDGSQSKSVSAAFSIKTDDKKVKSTNKDEINSVIIKAMQEIDYSELSEDNGTEYVKAVVKEKLIQNYGDSIEDVYLSDFINDVKIPAKDAKDKSSENQLNDTLKGLSNAK